MSGTEAALRVPDAAEILALDALGGDVFRARHNLDNYMNAAFGGQTLGQSLAAAQRTAPDWPANTLNGYFLAAGSLHEPVDYAVERVRDGRRFAARRVTARQGERRIFEMLCSFHHEEEGLAHQTVAFGDPPPPESCVNLQGVAAALGDRLDARQRRLYEQPFPVELRFFSIEAMQSAAPIRDFWFRMPTADHVPGRANHQALLALMSDYWLPGAIATTATRSGSKFRPLVSLNHAMWFHAPVRADDWLLYRTTSHWAANGRGLARGYIFDGGGSLVATVNQEALMRGA